jgi:predicted nucleotidyltransferase
MKRTDVSKKEHNPDLEAVAQQKLLITIFAFPEVEYSLTEMAEKANVSKSTASRIIQRLRSAGIVKVEDKGIAWRIRADVGNFKYIKRKIVHNLNILYQTNLVEFLETKLGHPPSIILFGSFRKGDDISTSDVDLAVETKDDVETQSIRIEGLEQYEDQIGKKIQILLYNRKKVDINVFNNIANGILLYGFLEVAP